MEKRKRGSAPQQRQQQPQQRQQREGARSREVVGPNGSDNKPAVSGGAGAAALARPKAKPAAERTKAVAEVRQSVIATRTQSLRQLFRDSWAEMKKVNWPDTDTTRNLTIVVIGISIVLGIALGGIDFLLQKLFEAMT